ncbi:hypothetical protein B9Z55_021365 [Caenorhabditis nigoni]|uniref:Uncharacterized protein n=1 Tax=Caenorhabditis nigoni TaxID=1611254 RepID=A0A2G5TS99_9PELO|nr:hypothetical protein B9Z55_021365 [Caenorhabditis nigoni]
MAGIVRKLFNSAKKSRKGEKLEDSDDDYSELHFGPTTSSSTHRTPSKPYQFAATVPSSTTPRPHDDTISDNDDQQSAATRIQRPTLKRRRVQDSHVDLFANSEESIYEYTQFQLMKWGKQAERHEERRKRRRGEREAEQENLMYSGIETMGFGETDVRKLRKERDQWKRDAEKYKRRCEELEKQLAEMKKNQQNQAFQPFPSAYNFFGGPSHPNSSSFFPQAPPSPFLLQPQTSAAAPTFPPVFPTFNSNPMPSLSLNPRDMDPSMMDPSMGPIGPMAPRFPDPIDDSLLFQDDDTSLSDLSNSSNSSKSDISGVEEEK